MTSRMSRKTIPQTARITGGIIAAKYPAERHIKMAPIIVVITERDKSINEYGSSVSRMVMSWLNLDEGVSSSFLI
jgi:hypothetical protein